MYFNSLGLYKSQYENTGGLYLIVGVSLLFITEKLKKYIEYKADEFAIENGCDKEELASAIKTIEEMNRNKVNVSGHPRLASGMKKQKIK